MHGIDYGNSKVWLCQGNACVLNSEEWRILRIFNHQCWGVHVSAVGLCGDIDTQASAPLDMNETDLEACPLLSRIFRRTIAIQQNLKIKCLCTWYKAALQSHQSRQCHLHSIKLDCRSVRYSATFIIFSARHPMHKKKIRLEIIFQKSILIFIKEIRSKYLCRLQYASQAVKTMQHVSMGYQRGATVVREGLNHAQMVFFLVNNALKSQGCYLLPMGLVKINSGFLIQMGRMSQMEASWHAPKMSVVSQIG